MVPPCSAQGRALQLSTSRMSSWTGVASGEWRAESGDTGDTGEGSPLGSENTRSRRGLDWASFLRSLEAIVSVSLALPLRPFVISLPNVTEQCDSSAVCIYRTAYVRSEPNYQIILDHRNCGVRGHMPQLVGGWPHAGAGLACVRWRGRPVHGEHRNRASGCRSQIPNGIKGYPVYILHP